ncbi:MAG: hypothetical protein V8R57_01565 [Evtepia sp.]
MRSCRWSRRKKKPTNKRAEKTLAVRHGTTSASLYAVFIALQPGLGQHAFSKVTAEQQSGQQKGSPQAGIKDGNQPKLNDVHFPG